MVVVFAIFGPTRHAPERSMVGNKELVQIEELWSTQIKDKGKELVPLDIQRQVRDKWFCHDHWKVTIFTYNSLQLKNKKLIW